MNSYNKFHIQHRKWGITSWKTLSPPREFLKDDATTENDILELSQPQLRQ